MKSLWLLPVVFFASLWLYSKTGGVVPFAIDSVSTTKTDTFSVTAEGRALAKPDIARIEIGVTADGATVKDAQDRVNQAADKVTSVIKKMGIDSKDIQTINYTINPVTNYQVSPPKINGYSASTTLELKIRDLNKVSDVVDAATANGANLVSGLTFDVDDKSAVQNEARQKAVAAAKEKANLAAQTAGFVLGRVINYQEDYTGGPRPVPFLASADAAPRKTAPTTVSPGTSEITVSVTLSYEIR